MLNLTKLYAIGKLAARQARTEAPHAAANDVIDMVPLLKPWSPGVKTAGMVEVYEGYPYKCVQDHDSTGNESWNPADAPSLWANYHATDAAHALPYVQPTGAHDAYQTGEYAKWKDKVVRCKADGTVHDPDTLPGSWEAVAE